MPLPFSHRRFRFRKCCRTCYVRLQLIQDDSSWAEAAAVALTAGDEMGGGGQEARLEQLQQRTQR